MWFIVVWWSQQRQGYQTFGDFPGALYMIDFQILNGLNAEMWMWDEINHKWYRIDFVNNDKHVPWAREVG